MVQGMEASGLEDEGRRELLPECKRSTEPLLSVAPVGLGNTHFGECEFVEPLAEARQQDARDVAGDRKAAKKKKTKPQEASNLSGEARAAPHSVMDQLLLQLPRMRRY